jgi:WD40 repeat protein
MVSGSWDKTVKISSLPGGKNTKTVTVASAVSAVSFHPDGKKILVSGEDGLCRLMNLNGKALADFKHPKDDYQIYSSAFSFSGDTIFTGADDGYVRSFLLDGTPLKAVHGHTGTVYSVRPVPKTNMLLSAGKEGRARLWRAGALTSVRVFRGHVTAIDWAKINSEGTEVLTGRDDGQFKYWGKFDYDGTTLTNKPTYDVTAFATPSAEMRVIYGGQPYGAIVKWDKTKKDDKPKEFTRRRLSGTVNSLDCTTNDTHVIAGTSDSMTYVLDNRGEILAKRKFENVISAVAITGDGSYALVAHQGTNKYSHNIKFWDWNRDSILWNRVSLSPITTVAFNRDNSICAVATSGTVLGGITLYRKNGQFIKRMFGDNKGYATTLDFSRNGRYLLTVNSTGEAIVWDGTEESNAELPLLSRTLPNGDTIVAAGFASYPDEESQSLPREIMLCGKNSGPIFYPFPFTELEGKNSDVEKLTTAQRTQYGIDFDFESCFKSDNLEEVSDCAEYFANSYLDYYNDESFNLAEKLYWRLIDESLQESTRERLTDLYQTKINRIEGTSRPNRYREIVTYSARMVELARQDSSDYPDSPEKMDALYSAYWNHSWYLILSGNFREALQAAESGLAAPSEDYRKNGIASNKALALLLTAPTYEVAKRFYDEWKDRPWVDSRHTKFRGAFLDDFESLRKEGVYEMLDSKQQERIRQMEAQLQEEEEKEAKKEEGGN